MTSRITPASPAHSWRAAYPHRPNRANGPGNGVTNTACCPRPNRWAKRTEPPDPIPLTVALPPSWRRRLHRLLPTRLFAVKFSGIGNRNSIRASGANHGRALRRPASCVAVRPLGLTRIPAGPIATNRPARPPGGGPSGQSRERSRPRPLRGRARHPGGADCRCARLGQRASRRPAGRRARTSRPHRNRPTCSNGAGLNRVPRRTRPAPTRALISTAAGR